jgi:hypothetical protein
VYFTKLFDFDFDFDFKILAALKGWVGLAPSGAGRPPYYYYLTLILANAIILKTPVAPISGEWPKFFNTIFFRTSPENSLYYCIISGLLRPKNADLSIQGSGIYGIDTRRT